MKTSRGFLLAAFLGFTILSFSNIFSLIGFFQSLEDYPSSSVSEKKTQAIFAAFVDQLKSVEDPEKAKRLVKSYQVVFSQSGESEAFNKLLSPLLNLYGSKPKEADDRYLLIKKRELMEGLVNAYRKEIPDGKIPLRAAYLNILFDTQNSLLSQDDSSEQVYFHKNKERFENLKSYTKVSAELAFRINNLESIFLSASRGFEQGQEWRRKKAESLAKFDKVSSIASSEFFGLKGDKSEDFRRFFLYSCSITVLFSLFSFLGLYLFYKIQKVKSLSESDAFLEILREFGREKSDPDHGKKLQGFLHNRNWKHIAQGFIQAERDFYAQFQALLAVPQSMDTPLAVFASDRSSKFLNPKARAVLGLDESQSISFNGIFSEHSISARDGSTMDLIELMRGAFNSSVPAVFEFDILVKGEKIPVEFLCYPILSGSMSGGRVCVWREIRGEVKRIRAGVSGQLLRINDALQRMAAGDKFEIATSDSDFEEIKASLEHLKRVKCQISEKESLWRSENQALMDQINRQNEILFGLSEEAKKIRSKQKNAVDIVRTIRQGDEDWHQEICTLDAEIERWKIMREQLEHDLKGFQATLDRAKLYEKEIRISSEQLENALSEYEDILSELFAFSEEAKVLSVNLGFSKDPSRLEFSARARAFSHRISGMLEQTGELSGKFRRFLEAHPASSLSPVLEYGQFDSGALETIQAEQERISAFFQRWRESGQGLVDAGNQAIECLHEIEKRQAVMDQMGETSLLLNQQVRENLARWS